jgi:uncharacterized BrkB/YihY/UPF0761 family membrane protein
MQIYNRLATGLLAAAILSILGMALIAFSIGPAWLIFILAFVLPVVAVVASLTSYYAVIPRAAQVARRRAMLSVVVGAFVACASWGIIVWSNRWLAVTVSN